MDDMTFEEKARFILRHIKFLIIDIGQEEQRELGDSRGRMLHSALRYLGEAQVKVEYASDHLAGESVEA